MRGAVLAVVVCLSVLLAGCQPVGNADPEPPVGVQATFLNPKDPPFNAKGDGLTDDTAALQAWLSAGGVRLENGSYRIIKGLTLAGDGRQFYTANAEILADGTNITALTVTGNNANVRAHIDGNSKAAYGLKVTGAGAVVENGQYENFGSTTQSARGIDATTNGGITVRNNIIRNVVSVGDGTGGNGNGLSRAIGLSARAAATATSLISGNHIENITGEEGDAISVLFSDRTANPYNSGNVSISDNMIRNVSRRFIKVQASNVTVERNKLEYDLVMAPANPSSAIDVIRSEYVKVIANEIEPNLIRGGIAVNGVPKAPLRGIEVRDNVLRQRDTKTSVSIYLRWTTSPVVQNNTVYGGGPAVLIHSSENPLVQGNAHNRGVAPSAKPVD